MFFLHAENYPCRHYTKPLFCAITPFVGLFTTERRNTAVKLRRTMLFPLIRSRPRM
jgi:hypothetical protein